MINGGRRAGVRLGGRATRQLITVNYVNYKSEGFSVSPSRTVANNNDAIGGCVIFNGLTRSADICFVL